MLYTGFSRSLGALVKQYVDDHDTVGMIGGHSHAGALRAGYIFLLIKFVHGGYWVGLEKTPTVAPQTWASLGLVCGTALEPSCSDTMQPVQKIALV